MPSTVLFGLLFIGWTQTPQASVQATTLIPAVVGLACLFLIAYISFVKKHILLAFFAALIAWSLPAYGLIAIHLNNFFVSLMLFIILFFFAYFFVTQILTISAAKGNKIVYSPKLLLLRGLLSGSVVVLSVLLAKTSGPVLGGMISAFPAMFSSTLLITYHAHGAAFSSSIAKNALFAWISTLVFVIVARYTMLPFGIIWGSLIALVVCYLSAYFIYTYVITKHA